MSSSNQKNLLSLLPFLKPYKGQVFLALLALIITALMVLFFGKAIKYLVDFAFATQDAKMLNLTLLAFLFAVLVMAIAGYYRSSLVNAVAEKVIADLRKKTYDHIIRVSAEFFEITKTGDVISRLTVDTVILYNAISANISFFLRNSLLFFGGILLLFLTSVKLSLLSLGLIPLAIAPVIIMGKKVKKLASESQNSLSLVGSHIEETINGIKTIQSYLCEEKEARNFSKFVDEALKISLTKIRVKSLMVASVIGSAFGGVALVLWIGGHDVMQGKITSGDLSSFLFYAVVTATSLVSISQIMGQFQSASSAAARIFELLETSSPVREIKAPLNFVTTKEVAIKFSDVNFSYPSRKEVAVLKNFNLEIKPHEKIAIVGSSGSGKSTILQLLLRFYDVDGGAVFLNEFDIKSLTFSDVRKNFSYISQDCLIFSGTIFENIAYADRSITEAQVEEIIAQNQSLNFINHLPQKLHTFVGEKGIKLSGGERQRIAIARAIIKDSPILLFDEATSALDNQNEQIINAAMLDLAKNKTVITVAHKLSSVINCDRIIFIKDGEIVESGSHAQLIEKGGFYKKMYEAEVILR
jgi:ATP-binding cassette subfamily B protein